MKSHENITDTFCRSQFCVYVLGTCNLKWNPRIHYGGVSDALWFGFYQPTCPWISQNIFQTIIPFGRWDSKINGHRYSNANVSTLTSKHFNYLQFDGLANDITPKETSKTEIQFSLTEPNRIYFLVRFFSIFLLLLLFHFVLSLKYTARTMSRHSFRIESI